MGNIIFHIILTNQCNKRCSYCDLNFSDNTIDYKDIDTFIDFIDKNNHKYREIRINFFWWEPLLEFEKMEYIIKNIHQDNVFYSTVSNGILLTEKKYNFLIQNKVYIDYSVDVQTYYTALKQNFFTVWDKNTGINLILQPKYLDMTKKIFTQLVEKWFTKFNILPVYATIKWEQEDLVELNIFIEYLKNCKNIELTGLSYYEKPTSDAEYVIETTGKIYADIHTHLWFLKQYDFIDEIDKNNIEKTTYITNLGNIDKLLDREFCKFKKLLRLSLEIPMKYKLDKSFQLIHHILEKLK